MSGSAAMRLISLARKQRLLRRLGRSSLIMLHSRIIMS